MKWIKLTERMPELNALINDNIIIRDIKYKTLLASRGYFEKFNNNKIVISTYWFGDSEEHDIDQFEWLDENEL